MYMYYKRSSLPKRYQYNGLVNSYSGNESSYGWKGKGRGCSGVAKGTHAGGRAPPIVAWLCPTYRTSKLISLRLVLWCGTSVTAFLVMIVRTTCIIIIIMMHLGKISNVLWMTSCALPALATSLKDNELMNTDQTSNNYINIINFNNTYACIHNNLHTDTLFVLELCSTCLSGSASSPFPPNT